MSDTTDTETETETNTDTTDEPSKAELHERVEQLESTVEKLMPSRRDALKLGAAGIVGAAGLRATSGSVEAATGSAGDIGDVNNRPDLFADTVDANSLSGSVKNQGCRVFLSSDQSISQGSSVKIQFDSEVYDSDNNFDQSTHSWTCPETGIYAVNLQVAFTGGGDGERREIRIGTATSRFASGEGARGDTRQSDTFDTFSISTINKYQSAETIVGYAVNSASNDTLNGGNNTGETFLEVAFLGGL